MNELAHILVVDDEPDLEMLIRQKFRREIRDGRMAFSFAGDGMEALERLRENAHIGILLTDINMPRMDGLTLLGKLADLDRLLKTVVVSAYGDLSNIRTAMNRGAFDFVTKPINFDDLAVTLERTHCEWKALHQAATVAQQWTALNRELEIASKIQLSMLPPAFPAFPDVDAFDLYATILPAQEVGGDLYDCFLLDDDRLEFVIGDVSGKGIGAAIFMAITRTMLRATALRGLEPAACLREVNRVLHPELDFGLFEDTDLRLRAARANPPSLLSMSGPKRTWCLFKRRPYGLESAVSRPFQRAKVELRAWRICSSRSSTACSTSGPAG